MSQNRLDRSGAPRRSSSSRQTYRQAGSGSRSASMPSGKNRRSAKAPPSPLERSMLAVLVVLVLLLFALGGFYLFNKYSATQEEIAALLDVDTFYEGIFIDGIPLGGKSAEEARIALQELYAQEFDRVNVDLNIAGQTVRTFTKEDIQIEWTLEDVLNQAYAIGRTGSRYSRYNLVKNLPARPRHLTTTVRFDASALEAEVRDLAASLYVAPLDAAFLGVDPTQNTATTFFRYSNSMPGRQVDADGLWALVQNAIMSRTYGTVEIPYTVLEPSILLSDVNQGQQLLGSCTTEMIQSAARISNIKLAASRVNGTVLESGMMFSYNKCLGPRTEEAGYQVAGIIVKGLSDTGLGGGICQLSSTLFVGAMRADLHMAARTRHSFVLSYIDAGQDATVDYDSAVDLCITNNTANKVYFLARTDGLKVIVEVYGTPNKDGITTDLLSKVIYSTQPKEVKIIYDESVPVGEPEETKEHLGVVVDVYKVYYNPDGTILREEFMYQDNYAPVQGVIRMNPLDAGIDTGNGDASPAPGTTPKPEVPGGND
jgi:vancomycin resistance protein YoaR